MKILLCDNVVVWCVMLLFKDKTNCGYESDRGKGLLIKEEVIHWQFTKINIKKKSSKNRRKNPPI